MGTGWMYGSCGVLRTLSSSGCNTCSDPWVIHDHSFGDGAGAFRLAERHFLLNSRYLTAAPQSDVNTNPVVAVAWPRLGTVLTQETSGEEASLIIRGADSPRSIVSGESANASGLYMMAV